MSDARVFVQFGTSHLAAINVLVVAALAIVWFGPRLRGTPRERQLRRASALALAATELAFAWHRIRTVGEPWTDVFYPNVSGVSVWLSVIGLWTAGRWLFAFLYYVGLGLVTQTFVTPVLGDDFPSALYVQYFLVHGAIILAPVWLLAATGLRPTWGQFIAMVLLMDVVICAAVVCNLQFDRNHLYLMQTPGRPTIFDRLGPVPYGFILAVALLHFAWAAMTVVWCGLRYPTGDIAPNATHDR